MSVLLHDIAKPQTQSIDETGRIRFFGHESEGAELAGRILDRLRFSTADREAIVQAVLGYIKSDCKIKKEVTDQDQKSKWCKRI